MKYFKDNNDVVYAYDADGSQDEYIKAGLIPISESEAMAIVNPPPTKNDLIQEAAQKKNELLSEVETVTKLWQTQLALGIITETDKEKLTEWMRYAQQIDNINVGLAPDITWPSKPA
ncbi:tail fiber assembly protein [Edwardsiella tarda]|uniref:tail fiber assembly protein n=1 Tax=Edwardsiella tarda TaxID=636 RepID=UPI00351C1093